MNCKNIYINNRNTRKKTLKFIILKCNLDSKMEMDKNTLKIIIENLNSILKTYLIRMVKI